MYLIISHLLLNNEIIIEILILVIVKRLMKAKCNELHLML
jgi:hypothetical protein